MQSVFSDFVNRHLRRPDLFKWSLAIVILTFVLYLPSLGNEFQYIDDRSLIYGNALIERISSFTLFRIFTSYDPELYVPLTLLSYQIDHLLAGFNPTMYHFTNLVLHCANVWLVTSLLSKVTRNDVLAIACGATFALHPLNTEAVVWAASRKDLLSALFFLLSMHTYLRFQENETTKSYAWSIVWFACALMSKVVVLGLPVVLLALDIHRNKTLTKADLKNKIPYFALAVAFGVIALIGKSTIIQGLNAWESLLLACRTYWQYALHFVLPTGLSPIYPVHEAIVISDVRYWAPVLFTVVTAALLLNKARRDTTYLLATVLIATLLFPNFTNFLKHGFVFLGVDRYAYLPMIGLLLFIGHRISRGSERLKRTAASLIPVAVFGWAVMSFMQSDVWRSPVTMYEHTHALYPDSVFINLSLGSVRLSERDFSAARKHFETADATERNHLTLYYFGQLAERESSTKDAISYYEQARDTLPEDRPLTEGDLTPLFDLANLLQKTGRASKSVETLESAVELAPHFARTHYELAKVLRESGRKSDAVNAYENAIERDPYMIEARYELAALLAEQGDIPQALEHLEYVRWMNPSYKDVQKHIGNIKTML